MSKVSSFGLLAKEDLWKIAMSKKAIRARKNARANVRERSKFVSSNAKVPRPKPLWLILLTKFKEFGVAIWLKFLAKFKEFGVALSLREPEKNTTANALRVFILPAEKLFLSLYSGLTFVMLIVILQRNSAGVAHPFDTILTNPLSRYGDFFGVSDEWFRFGWSSPGYGMLYLPATYIPIELLQRLGIGPYKSVFLLLLSMLVLLLVITRKILKLVSANRIWQILLLCLTVTCYPIWFIYGTANLEGFLLLSIFAAYFFLLRSQNNLAALMIGVAASFKIFPILFLLVFLSLSKVNYRKIVYYFSLGFVIPSALAVLFLPRGVFQNGFGSFLQIIENTVASQEMYAELMYFSQSGTHFGHSFLNGIHSVFGENFWPTRPIYLYSSIALILFGLTPVIINLLRRRKMNLFMLSVVTAVIGCLAPPTSNDYKLWYFLPACFVFSFVKNVTRIEKIVFILLPIILVAKPYLHTGVQPWANANSYVTPTIMVLIILLLIIDSVIQITLRRQNIGETVSLN